MLFLKALIYTVIIELALIRLVGIKDKKVYLFALIANVISNPALNFTLSKTMDKVGDYGFYYILFCEFIVVLFEYLFLKFTLKEFKLPFFKLSFLMNAVSFLIGLIIMEI